jgi:cytochrome c553
MRALAAAVAFAFAAAHAPAQEVDVPALRVRSLAASCAQCHGTDGHAPTGAAIPGLAGLPRERFLARMAAFRAGADPGADLMRRIAAGYDDAQLQTLAAYFAAQPP